ncbi:MAG: amidotransferase 1, exosortase A system-associated [Ectothiorhodospiraceae bacterium]|nr:amidotransferase 1, exosortase A system-associated [Ectothiorhodospiraceae bacterium]
MCGLVGIFDTQGQRPIDEALLTRMNQTQLHRGPDEGGIHTEPGVGLGHRRLSIIDLSSGQQPLFNEDNSVVVVYNGEIYNFQELAKELQAKGHVFRTHCDTEVIVHAWEEWGEACVDRFRGMFAFALWDRNSRRLFLARDRLGIKPLYYALLPDGHLIFGSELKSLLIHPGLPRETDLRAVEDYFAFGYVPEPKTILQHAKKLSPGFVLSCEHGKPLPEPRQYWDIPFAVSPISDAQAEEEMIVRLREAVDIRMLAEVPLGAFLSGGVDSSAVVAMMAGLSDDPVNTCSISFGDPKFNESEFAAQVAGKFNTRHQVEQVAPDDFDLLDQLANIYDEPFADSSAMPTYRVCQLARKHVTVALSGDGGDENLAGYRRYRWHMNEEKMRRFMPDSIRKPLFGLMGRLYPKADWAPKVLRAKATFECIARDSIEGYFHSVSIMGDSLRGQLFSKPFKKDLQGYHALEVFRHHEKRSPTQDPMSMIQYIDMKTYLVGDILTKVDRASMAHSLEVRVPLLDHKLVEWMSSLSPNQKLRGREGKYVFKKSLEPHLPKDILYRQKMGFAVPLASWFRGPLKDRIRTSLLGDTLASTGYFNRDYIKTMVDQHQSGRRDNSASIWTLLMFEAFQRKVLGNSQ